MFPTRQQYSALLAVISAGCAAIAAADTVGAARAAKNWADHFCGHQAAIAVVGALGGRMRAVRRHDCADFDGGPQTVDRLGWQFVGDQDFNALKHHLGGGSAVVLQANRGPTVSGGNFYVLADDHGGQINRKPWHLYADIGGVRDGLFRGAPEQGREYPQTSGGAEQQPSEPSYPPVWRRIPTALALSLGANWPMFLSMLNFNKNRRVRGGIYGVIAVAMFLGGGGLMLALGIPATWSWWV